MDKLAAVREFMLSAGQHVPNKLSVPDGETRILRAKLILEEALEFAKASGLEVRAYSDGGMVRVEDIDDLEITIKPLFIVDVVEVADATADLKYVVYGSDVAWGIPEHRVFAEVHRSNMSKFIDGHRRIDGKWIKGPSYAPADIKGVLFGQAESTSS